MRWNLAVTYGLDAADEFLRRHRSLAFEAFADQSYWELVTVLDLVPEIDPDDWSGFDRARLERYVESVLAVPDPSANRQSWPAATTRSRTIATSVSREATRGSSTNSRRSRVRRRATLSAATEAPGRAHAA
jgi:hypothetical protein